MSERKGNARPEAAAPGVAEPATSKPKRVLLVEGDGFTRLVLLLRLRLAGFGVDFTSNGTLGLGKLRSCHPDILLVELKLCGLSGLELIRAARAEAAFGDRPIYVFTRVDRMNRTTRKEVKLLATKVFDKGSMTREDLVKTFTTMYLSPEPAVEQPPSSKGAELPAEALSATVVSGAIEEIIAGVRDQSELLAKETGARAANGVELLSRVCSLGSCAGAAGLANLARQGKALEHFLTQLCRNQQAFTDSALCTVTHAVEVMSGMSFETSGKRQELTRFSNVLIDEAPRSNRATKEALLNAGFDPVSFEDPARARAYLASHPTQLIIANVVLPEAHSLSLIDIRQLPLHAQTPVLFGPESPVVAPLREQLPTSAARLDSELLLLTELVVRALNEVQGANTSALACPTPASLARGAVAKLVSNSTAAASLPLEDDFELFAKSHSDAPALQVSAQRAAVSGEANDQRFGWSVESQAAQNTILESLVEPTTAPAESEQLLNQLFTAADIPSELFLRAEPGTQDEDGEAELVARLPATPSDGSQIDEPAVEALPPSMLREEEPQPPQPETTVEDQTATGAWLEAVSSEAGESVPVINVESEPGQNDAVAVEESTATAATYVEVMNNQLHSESTEYAPEREGSQPGEALNTDRNQREDLAARVCESEMALYHSQAQNEGKDKVIEALRKELAEATTDREQASVIEQKAQARCAELEEEMASLRLALEDFNGSFGHQQEAATETSQYVQELEQRLSQSGAELEKQREEQRQAEAELRRQLDAANEVKQQNEATREQAEARCTQLEQELGGLRQAHGELANKLAQEQKLSAESGTRVKQLEAQTKAGEAEPGAPGSELEQQVRQGVAALARATAELAKERGERQRSQKHAAELNGRLQVLHEDFSRTLQVQRESLERIGALEEEQRQTSQTLERRTADLEQQQAEHRLAEEQLQKAKEVNSQLRKDLSFFEQANKKFDGSRSELQTRLEAGLNAARENEARLQQETAERQRLAESLEAAQSELQNQARRREALEQELQTAHDKLQEREAKLQKEAAERQRLNEAQNSVRHNVWDGSERDLEFSKLQSSLELEQVERKRQETQLARMRQKTLDAVHAARALRTTLRRQIREPVDSVVQSARSLLEQEMGEEQKKLAEAVLQDVLLVQTRLREPELAHGDRAEVTAPPSVTPS